MITVKDILDRKGYQVVTISPEDSILEAAKRMNEAGIGALVVVDKERQVAGIFTERDILRRVVAACLPTDKTQVGEVMSTKVACCRLNTTLAECQSVITSKRIRHLPVVEGTELVGMISSGDILSTEREVHQTTIEYLHAYIHGRT